MTAPTNVHSLQPSCAQSSPSKNLAPLTIRHGIAVVDEIVSAMVIRRVCHAPQMGVDYMHRLHVENVTSNILIW